MNKQLDGQALNVAQKIGLLYQGSDYGKYVFAEGTVGCLWVHEFNTPQDFYLFLLSRLSDNRLTESLKTIRR